MQFQAKSFKQAIRTLINDINNNRCQALALRDAINGLSLQDSNQLIPCINRSNSRDSRRNLALLLASVMEIIVVTTQDGKQARMNYGTDEKQAIEVLKYYKLNNITAFIEVE